MSKDESINSYIRVLLAKQLLYPVLTSQKLSQLGKNTIDLLRRGGLFDFLGEVELPLGRFQFEIIFGQKSITSTGFLWKCFITSKIAL